MKIILVVHIKHTILNLFLFNSKLSWYFSRTLVSIDKKLIVLALDLTLLTAYFQYNRQPVHK